jgi:hypothetical protein
MYHSVNEGSHTISIIQTGRSRSIKGKRAKDRAITTVKRQVHSTLKPKTGHEEN